MSVSSTNPDPTLVERVRKLLDKAARTDNEHESVVFERKAAELVARHRIDPNRIADRSLPDDLDLVEIEVGRGAYVRGRLDLLHNIADSQDVRMVFRSTPEGSVATLAGRRDDLDIVDVMYVSLHQQVASKMAELRGPTGASTQRQRRAFLFGFASRVGELLAETRVTVEESAARSDAAGTTALVLRERRARVDEFAERSWGRVRSASAPSAVSSDGFARGFEAADRADLGRKGLGARPVLGQGSG